MNRYGSLEKAVSNPKQSQPDSLSSFNQSVRDILIREPDLGSINKNENRDSPIDSGLDSTDEIVKSMETSSVFSQIKPEVSSKKSEKNLDFNIIGCKIEPKVESDDGVDKRADVPLSSNNDVFQSSCDYEAIKTKKLSNIHKGIVNRPQEDELHEDPPGLKTKLMVHQKHGLAWMRWRESQKPRGWLAG